MLRTLILFVFLFPSHLFSSSSEQQLLVDKASTSLNSLFSNSNYTTNIQKLLDQAYGIILIPDYVKAGFLIGGEGGSGVILTKLQDQSWSYPSFVRAYGGSFGLQAGVENSEILLIVMTDKGMKSLVNDSFTLGTDLSIAAGTLGGGLSAQTTANLSADIFAFSHSKGLFGGAALKGTVIKERSEWNAAYYHHKNPTPEDILRRNLFHNPGAQQLRNFLAEAQNYKPAPTPVPSPAAQTAQHYNQPSPPIDLAAEAAPESNTYVPSAPTPSSSENSGPKELLPWSRG